MIRSATKLPWDLGGALFKGCVPADHLDEVGHHTKLFLFPDNREGANPAGFDHIAFYKAIATRLDAEVDEFLRAEASHDRGGSP